MRGKAWVGGEILEISEATVPATDHGLLYGDGVFEGIRIVHGGLFRLDRHLDRLEHGARVLDLRLPESRARIREIVLETARAFGEPEAYVRLLVTRGEGAMGVDPQSCPRARIVCLATSIALYPEAKLASGIDLVTSSWRRPQPDMLDPRVKSLNYLNSAMAKLEAKRAGADEALLLNAAGNVAEAAVANLFALRDDVLLTPPGVDGALEGITRASVIEIAEALGRRVEERSLSRFDLFAASEVFLSGSGAAGLVPVRSLDGREIGEGRPGPVYAKLRDTLRDAAVDWVVPFAE